MDEALQILVDEHKNILKVIAALNEKCNEEIDKEFFNKAISFIKNYADKFHHAKEEDILFKELGQVEMHCNPMQQMLHEHDLGRDFVKGMEEGLASNDREKVKENARGYAHLLQEHIFKEDQILYPMADGVLSPEKKKEILEKSRQIRTNFPEIEKQLEFVNSLD
tara:strand:+ start:735 stop:1229 length:495 start_codon:yes stop_codon:yes gene_type:complete